MEILERRERSLNDAQRAEEASGLRLSSEVPGGISTCGKTALGQKRRFDRRPVTSGLPR